MSLWKYLFDNDFSQRVDLDRLEAVTTQDRDSIGRLEARLEQVERDMGRVVLLNEALVRIVTQRGVCSSAEVEKLVRDIDLEDGVEDGRYRPGVTGPPPGACPGCGRPIPTLARRCIYCGVGA